jgi:DUF1680 family protein
MLDGRNVILRQHTRYPWDGEVNIQVEGSGTFSLWLRIPAWCEAGASLEIGGQPFPAPLIPGSYAEIHRTWQSGDTVQLTLPMPVRCVECHPYVAENAGRVALMRGPVLYCVERADNPGLDPRAVILPAGAEISAVFRPDLLGGVVVLTFAAILDPPDNAWEDRLIRTACANAAGQRGQPVEMLAIPYYAWANREPGPMQVWFRTR